MTTPHRLLPPFQSASADRRLYLSGVLVAAAALAAFLPAVRNGFVGLDDVDYVCGNRRVSGGLSPGGIVWALTSFHAANWHPVTWLSHMGDATLFGLEPWGHHLTSVLLHAANAVLALLFLERLTGSVGRSAFAAGLFALHPLRVESVAWVSERKDVLAAFFALLALLAWLRHLRRRSRGDYAAACLLFAFALAAKPMPVTLPLLLLLLDWWPFGRAAVRPWPALLAEKLPFLVLSAASSAVTLVAQRAGGALSWTGLPLLDRLVDVPRAYVWYLAKMVWPTGLAVYYPVPPPSPLGSMAALALLAALSAAAFRLHRRHPWLLFGWLWLVVSLVPVLGVVRVGLQLAADRYSYLPALGFAVAAVWGVGELLRPARALRAAAAAGGVVVLLAAGAGSVRQIGFWKDSQTLFRRVLAVMPENWMGHYGLAIALAEAGDQAGAEEHYRAADRLEPGLAPVRSAFGGFLLKQGRLIEAEQLLRDAVREAPDYGPARLNLGNLLLRKGDVTEAFRHLDRAAVLLPETVEVRNDLAAIHLMRGDLKAAAAALARGAELDPAYPPVRVNLGLVSERLGQPDEARRHYREALRLDPGNADARRGLERVGSRP